MVGGSKMLETPVAKRVAAGGENKASTTATSSKLWGVSGLRDGCGRD